MNIKTILRAALVSLAICLAQNAAIAAPLLGRVEALFNQLALNLFVEAGFGSHADSRPQVAAVRLCDSDGNATDRIFATIAGKEVEVGDVVAVAIEYRLDVIEQAGPLKLGFRAARVTGIVSKHISEMSCSLFRESGR